MKLNILIYGTFPMSLYTGDIDFKNHPFFGTPCITGDHLEP